MTQANKDQVFADLRAKYDIEFVDLFLQHGAKVYLFGGAPRDIVMGKPWKDADFCVCISGETEKKDAEAEKIFQNCDILIESKTPLGPDKTIYRFKDKKSGGLIDVRVVTDMWAGGSDFTINALRLDLETGEIIDHYNSVRDINAKILKTFLEPDEAFSKDMFMIPRTTKAACQLGFALDEDTKESMKKNVGKLDECIDFIAKNETDFAEWTLHNLFIGLKSNPALYFSLMEEIGAFPVLVKSFGERLDITPNDPHEEKSPYLDKTPGSYEESINIFLSYLSRQMDEKDASKIFEKIVDLLAITKPKKGDDFVVNASQIHYVA